MSVPAKITRFISGIQTAERSVKLTANFVFSAVHGNIKKLQSLGRLKSENKIPNLKAKKSALL